MVGVGGWEVFDDWEGFVVRSGVLMGEAGGVGWPGIIGQVYSFF